MIILIDGPDGTGKSTLARAFESRGLTYVHRGPPEPGTNLFADYAAALIFAAADKKGVVFDRMWPAEMAYGRHMRNNSRISGAQAHVLNKLLFELNGVSIICLTETADCLANWRRNIESEYVKDEAVMTAIIGQYWEIDRELFWDVESNGTHYTYNYAFHHGHAGEFADEVLKKAGPQ